MRSIGKYLGVLLLTLFGFTSSHASASFSVGTDNFYLSVGDYDYLPYSPAYAPTRINFYDVMNDYGTWVNVSTFGRCWRPYAAAGWRPYVNGHWIQTQYGPYWQGYEPWAWAGYHYGNWIYSQQYGWVWIPGYDWHAGRVAWARSADTIGWSPAPPYGYDYSRGYLSYRGNFNQYAYDDPYFDSFNDTYGGPCADPRYGNLYCNNGYRNVSVNLWVFVDRNRFGYDNYADFYLGRDYVRNVFDRRLVRIHSRPIRRDILERVVKQRLREVPVRVREFDTDKRRVKVVVPVGQEEQIRKFGNRTVREYIAPAFVKNHKNFKGLHSKNEKAVATLFRQDNRKARVEKLSEAQVLKVSKENQDRHEKQRSEFVKTKNKELVQLQERIRKNEELKRKNAEPKKISERPKTEAMKIKSSHESKSVRKEDQKRQVVPVVRKQTYTNKDLRQVSRKEPAHSKPVIHQSSKTLKVQEQRSAPKIENKHQPSKTVIKKEVSRKKTSMKAGEKKTASSKKSVKKTSRKKPPHHP